LPIAHPLLEIINIISGSGFFNAQLYKTINSALTPNEALSEVGSDSFKS